MRQIHVNASQQYDVIIGSQLLGDIVKYVSSVSNSKKVAIVSDTNVWPLYGPTIENSLKNAKYSVSHFLFPAGESSKTPETFISILNFLAENQLTRTDLVIALGGGVVGDITGFAAATFLRGVPYMQIPTSLLAMVDSSVGGKTAIDLPSGKNLAGAFYQPKLVLCDIDTLNTLPESMFRDGCAEVIKYGILYDQELFAHLECTGINFCREYVISRCVELKSIVVTEDEFDTGSRQQLNLGHTIGHSVEALSNFTVTHGQAVSIGMSIISKACCKTNVCADHVALKITSVLKAFSLPVSTEFSAQQLTVYTLSDKKRTGDMIHLIVPLEIGHCMIRKIPVSQLQSIIEAGL